MEKLTFMGQEIGESYRPIEHIIRQAETFMELKNKGCLGGFLTHVMEDNFTMAVCRADAENIKHIRQIALFFTNAGAIVRETYREL